MTTPLVEGQNYTVSFFANAAWNGADSVYPQFYIASSHVGALFTMQPRQWIGGDPWPFATGSVHVFHPWIISDTVNWTLVSGSFVADSAYQYLMVGNHFDNSITDTISLGPSIQLPKAYTLIDNVCVSAGTEGCPLANGLGSHTENEVLLFPNPAVNDLVVNGLREATNGTIQDVTGRLVWRGLVGQTSWRLNASAWARGHYVLNMIVGEKHRSYKFVLME